MKNLQEATERICELKGSLVALDALVPAVIHALPESARATLMASFDAHAEAARTVMLHADISDVVLATFERDVARDRAILLGSGQAAGSATAAAPAIDGLLLATTRITPFDGPRALPAATGFFFRRGDRLFLVSDRRVFTAADRSPAPDRLEIRVHQGVDDLADTALLSLPLRRGGRPAWRDAPSGGQDGGPAMLEIPADALPRDAAPPAFDATHLAPRGEEIAIGDPLTIVAFPHGFDDTLNHLAVARGAFVASAFGIRYRGQACFLTDGGALPGMAGAPVVRRRARGSASAPTPSWQLVGVHAGSDGPAGLDRAWYADALPALAADD